MKTPSGFISAQMHQSAGGRRVLVNLAVWESSAALREAVFAPEFATLAGDYPPGSDDERVRASPGVHFSTIGCEPSNVLHITK